MSLTLEDAQSLTKEQLIEIHQRDQIEIQAKELELQSMKQEAEEKQFLIDNLQEQVEKFKRYHLGRRSEKFEPGQMLLFEENKPKHISEEFEIEVEEKPKGKPKRKEIICDLPVLPAEPIELSEDELDCESCHKPMEPFGEEVTRQYEYVPATMHIKETKRYKYSCKKCRKNVKTARMPSQAIPKSNAGFGLLSHLLVSKYQDHLPLNRLCNIFRRHGVEFKYSTLSDWVIKSGELLQPIVDYMRAEILKSKSIHTDDTTLLVQGKKKGQSRLGRLWVYLGDNRVPYTTFEYSPNRKGEHPQNHLANFKGYIHADAYAGYNPIYRNGATEVACWAHSRRKFFDAFKSSDPTLPREALEQIAKLYLIEREGKLMSPSERKSLRQAKSKIVLNNLKVWLLEQDPPPKSEFGKAVTYAVNQWNALTTFTQDGELNIDNNPAEQALRFIAIGRKNWLFAGSDRSGKAAANICSLIATCRRHEVDPFVYIHDALVAMADARDCNRIDDAVGLTPYLWKQIDSAKK